MWKIERKVYRNFHCAIKSDIPLCCILYYNLFWDNLFYTKLKKPHKTIYLFSTFTSRYLENDVQYVRFPICRIRNKKVKIKHCDYGKCLKEDCYR